MNTETAIACARRLAGRYEWELAPAVERANGFFQEAAALKNDFPRAETDPEIIKQFNYLNFIELNKKVTPQIIILHQYLKSIDSLAEKCPEAAGEIKGELYKTTKETLEGLEGKLQSASPPWKSKCLRGNTYAQYLEGSPTDHGPLTATEKADWNKYHARFLADPICGKYNEEFRHSMATGDWRGAKALLEKADSYFSRLKETYARSAMALSAINAIHRCWNLYRTEMYELAIRSRIDDALGSIGEQPQDTDRPYIADLMKEIIALSEEAYEATSDTLYLKNKIYLEDIKDQMESVETAVEICDPRLEAEMDSTIRSYLQEHDPHYSERHYTELKSIVSKDLSPKIIAEHIENEMRIKNAFSRFKELIAKAQLTELKECYISTLRWD